MISLFLKRLRTNMMRFIRGFQEKISSVILILTDSLGLPLISFSVTGNTEQDSTTETFTNPLANYIIPFRCGMGTFDMSLTNATNVRWLYNGTISSGSRFQRTTVEDEVVWLLVDAFSATSVLSNSSLEQPIKLDLADLQGKITYHLSLARCSNLTGSLADLQGKITYSLWLAACPNVTGVYTPVGDGVPTRTNLQNTGLSSADMDATLIAYAGASKDNGSFTATGMTRTAASDTAVATLTGRGWAITGITKV